jgi:translation initiation factor 4G
MLIKKSKEELEKGIMARKEMKAWEEKEGKSKLKGEDKEVATACRAQCVRMLSAVNFCGNLYKSGILTDKVVHSYVESLLKDAEADPRTEDAESLCSLLKLIGSKLDATSRGSRDGKTVDKWYERIAAVKDQAVSKEISKLFNSVLTLRAEGWGNAEALAAK